MSKIFSLAFVFFSVPGYATWVVIGLLLMMMGLFEALMHRRPAVALPLVVRRTVRRR
jgi:hypothetical protein